MFKILNAYECINVHARRPPETRRTRYKDVISTPNTFALYQMAARSGRRAIAGNVSALRCMRLETKAGHTPAARPALEQQAVTILFLQVNIGAL